MDLGAYTKGVIELNKDTNNPDMENISIYFSSEWSPLDPPGSLSFYQFQYSKKWKNGLLFNATLDKEKSKLIRADSHTLEKCNSMGLPW